MNKNKLAYIIGVAIGDGNLSNPNGRAVRLRVTCDKKYPNLIKKISKSITDILPNNKVSIINRTMNCLDISCYSNKWEDFLGWKAKLGPKYNQNVRVPDWIKSKKTFTIKCLEGLIETDGSVYKDRKYKMVNFTTIIPPLAEDVYKMIRGIGFKPNLQIIEKNRKKVRYNIRVSKNAEKFIKTVRIYKE